MRYLLSLMPAQSTEIVTFVHVIHLSCPVNVRSLKDRNCSFSSSFRASASSHSTRYFRCQNIVSRNPHLHPSSNPNLTPASSQSSEYAH